MTKISTTLGIVIFFTLGLFYVAHAEPAEPTAFTATPISACAVELSWNQPEPGADFFRYQWRDEAGNVLETRIPQSGSLAGTPATGAFVATSTELISRRSYWYKVKSCDVNNVCSFWTEENEKITLALPAAPGAPNLTSITGTYNAGSNVQDVEIRWATTTEAAQGEKYAGFSIFMSANGGAFSHVGDFGLFVDPNDPESKVPLIWRELGLNPNSYYTFRVYEYDSDLGCRVIPVNTGGPTANPNNQAVFSGASNELTISVRPTDLAASWNVDTEAVDLNWIDNSSAPANETFFELQKATNSSFTQNVSVIQVGADTESFTDSNVQTEFTYWYRIRGCTAPDVCSAYSNSVEITTGVTSPELDIGIYYASSTSETAEVHAAWKAVLGIEYKLQRSSDSEFSNPASIQEIDPVGASTAYDSVATGKTYYYRVKATRSGQNSFSAVREINLDLNYILKGVGWSAAPGPVGVGWIKFRNDTGNKYSVQIDRDGLMSGAAWAGSSFGWLSFNKADLEGCPSGVCEARVDLSTGALSGWARFLAPAVRPNLGRWDGWVKLRGTAQNGDSYGVQMSLNPGEFSGAAWGGPDIGWIAFGPPECDECNVSGDLQNRAPTVNNVRIEIPADVEAAGRWCAEVPAYRVVWEFSDPDGNSQSSAELEFYKTADPTDVSHANLVGVDQLYRFDNPLGWFEGGSYNQSGYLATNTEYRARVRVSDGIDWSDWVNSVNSITTPNYYWPLIRIGQDPDPTSVGVITHFSDNTVDRSAGAATFAGRQWTFENAHINQSADPNPSVIFNRFPANVTLKVDDSRGASCEATRPVSSGGSRGEIKRRIFRER